MDSVFPPPHPKEPPPEYYTGGPTVNPPAYYTEGPTVNPPFEEWTPPRADRPEAKFSPIETPLPKPRAENPPWAPGRRLSPEKADNDAAVLAAAGLVPVILQDPPSVVRKLHLEQGPCMKATAAAAPPTAAAAAAADTSMEVE